MINPFRTIRFRLVLLNLVVFGAILLALGVVVLFVTERFLRREFDQRLIDGARGMLEAIEIAAEESPGAVRESRFRPHLNPFHFLEYYFQIRNQNGRLLERSANLGNLTLPMSIEAARPPAIGEAVLETLHNETVIQLLGEGQPLRLLTLCHQRPGMPPFFLQVGVSLTSVDHAIEVLRRTMLLLMPLGLLLAALASERLVRRSLAPIGRVARDAQWLSAAHFDRRLPVPAGKDEVVEMIRTLNGMLDRLQNAFNAQERFIANAAHELKTPVTHLLGQAQVLARQARRPEEYDQFIAAVQEDMRHLAMIVESLLLLARADAGLPLEAATRVSINEVAADAVERCHPFAAQREVRLEPTLCSPSADEDEPEVTGDAELLVSMVSNLVRNAIRFSPPNERVEIEVFRVEGQAGVAVRDRGPGIPADQLPRLFERFYQVHAGGRPTGSGLGLSIAQSAAKLHRGRITAENRPDGGSAFTVYLPVES
jgi:signal transduction histidine kinase